MKKLCFLSLVYFLGTPFALADDPKELAFVVEGMRNERLKVQKGLANVKGKIAYTVRYDPGKSRTIDFKVFFAFEDEKKIRFDRTQLDWVVDLDTLERDPDTGSPKRAGSKLGMVTYKYCNNSKKMAIWSTDTKQLEVRAAQGFYAPSGTIGFFDVRGLGLYQGFMLHDNAGHSLAKLLDFFASIETDVQVQQHAGKPWCLFWFFARGAVRTECRVWIDVENGFTPIRHQHKRFSPEGPQGKILEEATTKWERRGDIRVPVQFKFVRDSGGRGAQGRYDPMGGMREEIDMSIDWKSINEPVPQHLFEYQDLGAPKGINIIDSSLGPTIIVQSPGLSETSSWKLTTVLLFSALVLSLLGAGSYVLVRRRRQRKNA